MTPRSLLLLPILFMTFATSAFAAAEASFEKVEFFQIEALGVPVGFARLRSAKPLACPTVPPKRCLLFEYSVNLNKLSLLPGGIKVMSNVYVFDQTFLPHYISTRYSVLGKTFHHDIQFDYARTLVLFKDRIQNKTKQMKLPPNAHSLATVPIYLLHNPAPVSKLNVLMEDDFKTFQVNLKRAAKNGESYLEVFLNHKEYIRYNATKKEILYVRLIPLKLFGIPLGDIAGRKIYRKKE